MSWRTLSIAVLVALLAGGAIGWQLHQPPPAPAVQAKDDDRKTATLAQHVEVGPSRTTITDFAPPCPVCECVATQDPPQAATPAKLTCRPVLVPGPPVPGPERIVRQVVVEKGPSVTDTRAATETEHHAELVVTPPPPVVLPKWAFAAGLQLLPDKRLELALERRVFGPIWVRAWVLQAAAIEPPAVGLGVRFEF